MVLNPQSELNYLYLSLKAAAPFFSQSAVLTASARTVIIFSPSCSFDCRNSADRKSKTSTIIEINLLFLFFLFFLSLLPFSLRPKEKGRTTAAWLALHMSDVGILCCCCSDRDEQAFTQHRHNRAIYQSRLSSWRATVTLPSVTSTFGRAAMKE